MTVIPLKLKGTFEIQLEPHEDERGFFMRTYDKKIFGEYGIAHDWVEESESFSKHRGTVRGLHFQHPPYVEAKLMRVSSGEAFVVWVDIRKGSSTFGKWDSIELSAKKKNAVYVPRGFTNGLCTLSDDCALLYKIDNYYHPEAQSEILWNDPDIGIVWPVKSPEVMSRRDANAKGFKNFADRYGGLTV